MIVHLRCSTQAYGAFILFVLLMVAGVQAEEVNQRFPTTDTAEKPLQYAIPAAATWSFFAGMRATSLRGTDEVAMGEKNRAGSVLEIAVPVTPKHQVHLEFTFYPRNGAIGESVSCDTSFSGGETDPTDASLAGLMACLPGSSSCSLGLGFARRSQLPSGIFLTSTVLAQILSVPKVVVADAASVAEYAAVAIMAGGAMLQQRFEANIWSDTQRSLALVLEPSGGLLVADVGDSIYLTIPLSFAIGLRGEF